jgi:hypothetical protein
MDINNNIYVDLTTLKGLIGRTDTNEDARILLLARRASRLIDEYCGNNFYVTTTTKNFRSRGGYVLFLPALISITTVTIGGVELLSTDYELEPLNEYPKTCLRLLNTSFAERELVAITGKWGYSEISENSGDAVADTGGISAEATALTVADGSRFSIGEMLLIESEQVYVSNIVTNTLTIVRAQNGTTAATHAKDKPIYIMRAPDAIIQACIMQAIRFYRGRDAAFSNTSGGEATLQFREPALEIRVLLNPYKRFSFGE